MTEDWKLYLRGNSLIYAGEISAYEMDGVLRLNNVSTATVTFPLTAELIEEIDWGFGLVLTRDDVVIFSGPITGITDSPDGLTVELQDDTVNLEDRATPPTPTGPPYPDEYDVKTNIASTILRYLVDVHVGPSAIPARRFPYLTLPADPLLGPSITSRARFNSLIELLRELALSSGLGFRVAQSATVLGALEFQVYKPVDRTGTVMFSVEDETLVNYSYTQRASSANYIYALGNGIGPNRPVQESQDPYEITHYGRRIERVIDSRGSDSASDMAQAIAAALAGGATRTELQLEASDSDKLAFGRDYGLGDIVPVRTRRKGEVPGVIQEVEFSIRNGAGITFKPTVGTPGATGDSAEQASQQIAGLGAQISNLERNWRIPPASIDSSMLVPVLQPFVGEVREYAGTNVAGKRAQGWLLCDGSIVSRTTYAALFSELGTLYGAGDGSTTFGLPSFAGRLPMGASVARPTGSQAGSETFNNAHDHAGAFHDHLGADHSHLTPNHQHNTNIAHSHGNAGNETGATGIHEGPSAPVNAPPSPHTHPVPALGVTSAASNTGEGSGTSSSASASGGVGTTGPAQYGGNRTGVSGSSTQSVLNPILALNFLVYSGVAS